MARAVAEVLTNTIYSAYVSGDIITSRKPVRLTGALPAGFISSHSPAPIIDRHSATEGYNRSWQTNTIITATMMG